MQTYVFSFSRPCVFIEQSDISDINSNTMLFNFSNMIDTFDKVETDFEKAIDRCINLERNNFRN